MDRKELVRYFYEVLVTQNRLEELPQYISDGCLLVSGAQKLPLGVAGMRDHLTAVRGTYPDYAMRILRQYEDGETVISEFIMEGTLTGEWLGIKPAQKRLSFTGVDIDKVVDGKIAEHGGAVNTFETLYENRLIGPV